MSQTKAQVRASRSGGVPEPVSRRKGKQAQDTGVSGAVRGPADEPEE